MFPRPCPYTPTGIKKKGKEISVGKGRSQIIFVDRVVNIEEGAKRITAKSKAGDPPTRAKNHQHLKRSIRSGETELHESPCRV